MAKQNRINDGHANDIAWEFYQKTEKMKQLEQKYQQAKQEFEQQMEDLFDQQGAKRMQFGGSNPLNEDGTEEVLCVSKVERTSIDWFPDKLEKRVTKPIAKQVIKKKYTIRDMKGLSKYLASCGVDPNEFRKYIDVEKSVDQQAVDRLSNVGKIGVKNISGCYMVRTHKPYFKLSIKKVDGYDREEE